MDARAPAAAGLAAVVGIGFLGAGVFILVQSANVFNAGSIAVLIGFVGFLYGLVWFGVGVVAAPSGIRWFLTGRTPGAVFTAAMATGTAIGILTFSAEMLFFVSGIGGRSWVYAPVLAVTLALSIGGWLSARWARTMAQAT